MAAAQTVTQTPAAESPVPGWKQLLKLLPYLGRYKGGITLGMITLVAMGLVGSIYPLIIGVITDGIEGKAEPLGRVSSYLRGVPELLAKYYRPSSGRTVLIFCLALVVSVAIKGIFSFLTRWILIGVSREIEYDIRNDLLRRLLQLEPEFYVRNRTGELMSRATNDLNNVRMVLGPGIMYSATTIVTFVAAVTLMLIISPKLTIYVLIPVPVVALTVRYFGQIIHSLFEKIQASLATLSAKGQENFSGVRVIRAYGQEDVEARNFDETNREYVSKNMKLILAWSMFMPALTALIGVAFLIVLWQGGRLVMLNQITLGEWIAFNTFLGVLIWPMVALGWVTNIFQRGAASMGRLAYLLNARARIDDCQAGYEGVAAEDSALVREAPAIRGEIEFRDLTFAYPTAGNGHAAPAVLKDINLKVPAGSTLAIVGPTGSGKSTLAALVARLWDAEPGSVLVDGRPIREWPLASLRRSVGFVPQDTFLFTESLAENIAFGLETPDRQRIEDAAQTASVHGDISGFPAKFDTMVGERGITLSGGQKQRTALARAVIRDPRILVLDDALSSVDTETEERILGELREIMAERTTIIVSHRCSTVREADQIVVLVKGCIVERGTHEELLGVGGYYADLYQKQLLEEELERV